VGRALGAGLEKFGPESKFGLRNRAVSAERSFFCARSLPPGKLELKLKEKKLWAI
jgi:hypothetical protein